MGEDIPIVTIAERLARLRGKRVPTDVSIVFTGLRPGERLREALVGDDEVAQPTVNAKIAAIESRGVESPELWDARVSDLHQLSDLSADAVRERLLALASSGSLSWVAG
jgi:O-antigen biosynthesis protein WbqV